MMTPRGACALGVLLFFQVWASVHALRALGGWAAVPVAMCCFMVILFTACWLIEGVSEIFKSRKRSSR